MLFLGKYKYAEGLIENRENERWGTVSTPNPGSWVENTVSSFLGTLNRDSYLNSLHVSPIACKNLEQEQNRRMADYINF